MEVPKMSKEEIARTQVPDGPYENALKILKQKTAEGSTSCRLAFGVVYNYTKQRKAEEKAKNAAVKGIGRFWN